MRKFIWNGHTGLGFYKEVPDSVKSALISPDSGTYVGNIGIDNHINVRILPSTPDILVYYRVVGYYEWILSAEIGGATIQLSPQDWVVEAYAQSVSSGAIIKTEHKEYTITDPNWMSILSPANFTLANVEQEWIGNTVASKHNPEIDFNGIDILASSPYVRGLQPTKMRFTYSGGNMNPVSCRTVLVPTLFVDPYYYCFIDPVMPSSNWPINLNLSPALVGIGQFYINQNGGDATNRLILEKLEVFIP